MSSIPDHAVEVVKETWETGGKKIAQYYVEGEEIGYRYWEPSGVLWLECGLQNGQRHGHFRMWHDNGKLHEEGYYHDGKEHGLLSEEREYLDGNRHGYERWWNGDNRTIYEESHYWNGIQHGIFRRWNQQGKLRRGYPQYYVMGERMTKRQYERACQEDSRLPLFVASDNQPIRQVPAEVLRTSGPLGC